MTDLVQGYTSIEDGELDEFLVFDVNHVSFSRQTETEIDLRIVKADGSMLHITFIGESGRIGLEHSFYMAKKVENE